MYAESPSQEKNYISCTGQALQQKKEKRKNNEIIIVYIVRSTTHRPLVPGVHSGETNAKGIIYQRLRTCLMGVAMYNLFLAFTI